MAEKQKNSVHIGLDLSRETVAQLEKVAEENGITDISVLAEVLINDGLIYLGQFDSEKTLKFNGVPL